MLIVCPDFNPYMPNGIAHPYHFDESIANFSVVG